MLDRMQRLIEDLQQVSNDIAHDLRTPLTRLRQRLELALDGQPCAAGCPTTGEIEKAITEVDILLGTFSAMLRIAQINSGSRRAGFRTVDLSGLLRSLVETYGPVAEDARHAIRAHIAPSVSINGDADLLIQMFANLIENAIAEVLPMHFALCVSSFGPGGAECVAVMIANGLAERGLGVADDIAFLGYKANPIAYMACVSVRSLFPL